MGSYWLEQARDVEIPAVRLDGPADVEVVGAGVTGISAALTLSALGLRVRVHDAREVAGGASGRNGGFALRGGTMSYAHAVEWLGRERARAYWRLTEAALDRLASLAGDTLRRSGSLRIAADAEERAELEREVAELRADGFGVEWVDELPERLSGRFAGAILHPTDATIQPARLVRRLARLAAGNGVEMREHHRVESLDELEADHVLVATDGYPSGLLGELEGLIVPTRGQMIATEPLAERLFDRPHYGRHGFDYWQQLDDGRIAAGGFRDFDFDSEFTAEEQTTERIQTALERFVAELAGRPLRVTHRWAGIFGVVFDFLPVVGPMPGSDRVWIAGGYSGHGNVLGFLCGDLAARAMRGDAHPLLELFDPARL